MITAEGIRARQRRLAELALGLMKERAIIREAEDPMLYLERRAYLTALDDALAGIETARVTLVKALLRLDEASRAGVA